MELKFILGFVIPFTSLNTHSFDLFVWDFVELTLIGGWNYSALIVFGGDMLAWPFTLLMFLLWDAYIRSLAIG